MKFIFWNIRDSDEQQMHEVIENLIASEKPHVILLAETNISDAFMESYGFNFVHGSRKNVLGLKKNLKIYSTQKDFILTPHSRYKGELLACELEINNKFYLVFGCHLVSKLTIDDEDKRLERAYKHRQFIEDNENEFGKVEENTKKVLSGSIVFGDFNLNPFEKSMNHHQWGLFAIDIRPPVPDSLNGTKYFINPTLSIMSSFGRKKDGSISAPGTYWFDKKDIQIPKDYYWNAIDGMFFRPDLFTSYNEEEPLEVITEVCDNTGAIQHNLFDFNSNQINNNYSDHLPIKFTFNL